ncbi:hypothetical protein FACS189454_02570 [Planctomycetales bacterium]|nr:hypothetical protein FACS189454_02570 [Planctomycetales bacterium]
MRPIDRKLYTAVLEGNLQEASDLFVTDSPDVDAEVAPDLGFFYTILGTAINSRNANMVRFLIAKGADVNAKVSNELYPLSQACSRGTEEIAEMLIAAGADVNARLVHPDSGYSITILNTAVSYGMPGMVGLLIYNGAIIDGFSLYLAAEQGNTSMVHYLIDSGADVNARFSVGTDIWTLFTILGRLVNRGRVEMVELLIAKGADVNAQDSDGTSPLFVAACRGFTEIARILIAVGADVNAFPSPLLVAAGAPNASIEMVRLLVDNGADVNINNGFSLFVAAEKGNYKIVEYLIDKGADINARCEGSTPLEIAKRNGHTAIVRLLREKAATSSQQTPQPRPVPPPKPLFYICDNTGARQGTPVSRGQLQTLANQSRISPQTRLKDAAGRQRLPEHIGISFLWYYFSNTGTRQGPFTDKQIKKLIERQVIVRQTRLETRAGQQELAEQVHRFRQKFDSLANWYYYDNAGTRQGPFADKQITELIGRRVIVPQTHLETRAGRQQGLAEQVPRFKQVFVLLTPLFCICDNTGTKQGIPVTRGQLQTLANQGRISPQTPLEDAAGRQGLPEHLGISFARSYYFDNAGTRQGPFTDEQIEGLIDQRVIVRQTRLETEAGQQEFAERVHRFRQKFDLLENWYYFDNANTRQGPFTDEQIEELIEQRVIVSQTRLETRARQQGLAKQVFRFRQKFDSLPPQNTSAFSYGFKEYVGYKPIIVLITGTAGVGIAGSVIGWWLLLLWIIAFGAFFGIKYREYANLPDELRNLLQAAGAGGTEAKGMFYYEIGEHYHSRGKLENAIKYYDKAIKYGHEEAKRILGLLQAAGAGDAEAKVKLGMYFSEQGKDYYSKGDLENAIKYYDKAIEYGLEEAKSEEVGSVYYARAEEIYIYDDEQALLLYEKAAKLGNTDAQRKIKKVKKALYERYLRLGDEYRDGSRGGDYTDYNLASYFYLTASKYACGKDYDVVEQKRREVAMLMS